LTASEQDPARVLLTGAAGFAGSHALRHLLVSTDWDITCPVSLDHKGRAARIEHACAGMDTSRVTVFSCDLAQPLTAHARTLIGQPDYIINYASASHVDRSITDPAPFVTNNVALMLTLLEFARTLPALRALVHVSTDEVYGPSYGGELHGEDDQHRPSNPYAASKSCQSQLGYAWWRTYGVPFTEVYGCNMFGEQAQDPEKFFPKVMAAVAAGETVPVHAAADGTPGTRFWQHARNVADAILFICQNVTPARYAEDGAVVPSRYNVTSGDRISNLDLAKTIAAAMGLPLIYEMTDYHSSRPGHDLAYGIDGSRLRALGWQPPVDFETAVKRTVAWELDHAGTGTCAG
jgi:dTDP-glucose 4,6-dehydratase